MNVPADLQDQRYAYLTTQGRVTGRRHTAELWFVPAEGGVWLMSGSGGLTQWCLNLQAEEQGVLRVGSRSWLARVTFLDADDLWVERKLEWQLAHLQEHPHCEAVSGRVEQFGVGGCRGRRRGGVGGGGATGPAT